MHTMQHIISGVRTLYFCTCHLFFPSRPPAAEPVSQLTCYFRCSLSAKTWVHYTCRDFIISHSTQGCPLALFPLCFHPWFLQKVELPFPHFKVPALIQLLFHPTTLLIFTVLIGLLVFKVKLCIGANGRLALTFFLWVFNKIIITFGLEITFTLYSFAGSIRLVVFIHFTILVRLTNAPGYTKRPCTCEHYTLHYSTRYKWELNYRVCGLQVVTNNCPQNLPHSFVMHNISQPQVVAAVFLFLFLRRFFFLNKPCSLTFAAVGSNLCVFFCTKTSQHRATSHLTLQGSRNFTQKADWEEFRTCQLKCGPLYHLPG